MGSFTPIPGLTMSQIADLMEGLGIDTAQSLARMSSGSANTRGDYPEHMQQDAYTDPGTMTIPPMPSSQPTEVTTIATLPIPEPQASVTVSDNTEVAAMEGNTTTPQVQIDDTETTGMDTILQAAATRPEPQEMLDTTTTV
eukprot:5012085-Amphidinium_carterae.2